MAKLSNRNKGIIFLLLSALGFAAMSIFVKLSGDLPSFQKVFFRNLITMILSLGLIIRHRSRVLSSKKSVFPLLLRSAFGTLGMVMYFYAMDHMILSDANMLNKLSIFFLLLFSALFLKERMKAYQVISVVVAFVGALFIIKPAFQVETVPYLLAFGSSILAGGAYTFLRFLSGKEKFYQITFFFSTFSIIALSPLLIIYYEAMTPLQLLYLLLAGVCASIGQFGVTLAYQYAPAREISIFTYSNVIFVTVLSFVVFADYPDIFSILGYFTIFGASVYMFYKNKNIEQIKE